MRSEQLSERAARALAGGVSSDARRLPDGPLFVDHAAGGHLVDVDGRDYVDFVLGQGPAILGHAAPPVAQAVAEQAYRGLSYSAQTEDEVEVAEAICRLVPSAESVRFNSVGSEAVHAALRLARGFTGGSKIVKFEGHYHGWLDPVLYSVHPDLGAAGPGARPAVVGATAGQQASSAGDVIVVPWNDLAALVSVLDEHRPDIAAVILEPILVNTGVIMPDEGYLEGLVQACRRTGALVVFDEIITGFRMAPGGAQEFLDVQPDLAVFGKALAGGMQLSALVGRGEIMAEIASGRVAHAGTFNAHPVALAAARATLRVLDEQRDSVYPTLFARGRRLADGLRAAAAATGVPLLVSSAGPLVQTYVTEATEIRNYRDFAATDRAAGVRLHSLLRARGVNMVPRGLWFLCTAHTDEDIDHAVAIAQDALAAL